MAVGEVVGSVHNFFYRLLSLFFACSVCVCLCHALAGCSQSQIDVTRSGNAYKTHEVIEHQPPKNQLCHNIKVSHAQMQAFEESEKSKRVDGFVVTNKLPRAKGSAL